MTQPVRDTIDISGGGKIVVGAHGQIDIAGGVLSQDGVPLTSLATTVSSDEKDALDGAAAPSADNVFATIADIPVIPGTAIADVAGTTPAGGTGATAGAYDTAAHRDALIATVAEIKGQLNTLLTELRTAGVIASS